MKNRNIFIVTILLLCSLMGKSQLVSCPLTFTNMLGCQSDVDITWQFYDCTTPAPLPCGTGGSANVPFAGFISIPCGCIGASCELVITLTAVNGGCPIGPGNSISWSAALANGGKAFTVINCNGTACGSCCDSGNSIGIDINGGFAWAN